MIDPLDSQRIYAGNRNFSGIDYPNALYRSVDGGDTWTSLDQSVFLQSPGSRDGDRGVRVYLSCLAADSSRPGTILAAFREEGYDVNNGRGLLISRDWGDTWEPFPSDGLTCYRVGTLIVDPVNPSRIYAGTGGGRTIRSLDDVYEVEGLPERKTPTAGERRILQETETHQFVDELARAKVIPRRKDPLPLSG